MYRPPSHIKAGNIIKEIETQWGDKRQYFFSNKLSPDFSQSSERSNNIKSSSLQYLGKRFPILHYRSYGIHSIPRYLSKEIFMTRMKITKRNNLTMMKRKMINGLNFSLGKKYI